MKISIITATYNSADTVRDTFDSVLRQTYQDYELVVVDGASTDETVEIIKECEKRFRSISDERLAMSDERPTPSFRWISERDKGLYDAMNKGIAMATGDVVGILNSDDFYTSQDILASVADAFTENAGIDAVYGDIHYVRPEDLACTVRYYSSRLFRRGWMRFGFMPAHPSFYCRKSIYDRFAKVKTIKRLDDLAINDYPQYFDTSYKVAADFENLLRMIFVGRIKTHYIPMDFVTMRAGGVSNRCMESHRQINRDHLRALRENGVFSNIFFLSLRYIYKIGEIVVAKINID